MLSLGRTLGSAIACRQPRRLLCGTLDHWSQFCASRPSQEFLTPGHLVPKSPEEAEDGDLVMETLGVEFEGEAYPHTKIAYIKHNLPKPMVLVHHNYAGAKQFDYDTACFFAKKGFVGVAVDCYRETDEYTFRDRNPLVDGSSAEGLDVLTNHFMGAFAQMQELLWAPKRWRELLRVQMEVASRHQAVEAGRAAAMGFCLGGQAALEQLRAGHDLQAVVTMHGLLNSRPMYRDAGFDPHARLTAAEFATEVDVAENNYNTRCTVMIQNGDADEHVPEEHIQEFKREMDSNGVGWQFHNHAKTPHGWALGPGVTATEYQPLADRRSTVAMLSLLHEVWPDVKQHSVPTNASGTALTASLSRSRSRDTRS